MQKPKRKKVVRASLEALLAKKERRIQQMAEDAYKIREYLKQLYQYEARLATPVTRIELPVAFPNTLGITEEEIKQTKEKTDAIHIQGSETSVGDGSTNQDTRESNVPNPTDPETVLGE